ncbi:MAG TPA: methyltransferase [Rhizomicrobium sp.]|jgi:16S rRNA (guanine1207-N2)-methyltransferase
MIAAIVDGVSLTFESEPRLFSPARPDAGTLAMLSCVTFALDDKVLDLGCGYGLVGIIAAKRIGGERVWLIDNDAAAVRCAGANLSRNGIEDAHVAQSDGFRDFTETGFTKILCNPPYHSDFAVPKHFIEKGFNRLALGGHMIFVTKRKPWYENKLRAIFGCVRVREVDGYFVFDAEKRTHSYARKS